MIVNLKTVIPDKLVCPEGKRREELVDVGGTGLYIEVRATSPGQGTFYLRYKDANGKTCHQKIGRTTDMDLDEARAYAKTLKAEITLGKDPRAEANAKKAIPTLTEFMEDMYFPYIRARLRTFAKQEEYFRLRLKATFGHKRLNQITRREITLFHSNLLNQNLAPATCNHYLKLLKRSLNLAIQWDVFDGPNPTRGIRQHPEMNIVENYLDSEQLQRLLTVLQTDKNRTVCSIILFLLSTGARLSEALNAKWDHVNLEKCKWQVPATNSKSFKTRNIQLGGSAIDVLNQQDTKGKSEYVFLNKQTGKPYRTIQKVWQRLRSKAGLPHYRIHDARHQHASLLLENGSSLALVQKVLGHSSPIVTQRYAHLSDKSLQDAADSVSVILKDFMKQPA